MFLLGMSERVLGKRKMEHSSTGKSVLQLTRGASKVILHRVLASLTSLLSGKGACLITSHGTLAQ